MEFSRLKAVAREYRRLLITTTLLVGAFAMVGSVVLRIVHPTFISAAKVLVYPSEEDRALLKEASTFGKQDVETTTLSKTQIILSRVVLAQVAEKLLAAGEEEKPNPLARLFGSLVSGVARAASFLNYGPARDSTPLEQKVAELEQKVRVEIFPNTFITEIQARASSSAEAYVIAKTLSETYVEYTRTFNHQLAGESRRFIEDRAQLCGEQLFTAEEELKDFKEGSTPHLQTQAAQMILKEGEYRSQQDQIWTTLQELKAERRALLKEMEGIDQEVSKRIVEINPNLQQLRLDLSGLEAEHASMLEVYTPEHQSVKALESRMEKLREAIGLELERILSQEETSENPVYAGLVDRLVKVETLLISQEARLAAVGEVLAKYEALVGSLPAKEVQLIRHSRSVDVLSAEFLKLQEKLAESRLLELAKLYDIRIVEPAVEPLKPKYPAILMNTILGLFVGLLLALSFVIAIEYSRSVA